MPLQCHSSFSVPPSRVASPPPARPTSRSSTKRTSCKLIDRLKVESDSAEIDAQAKQEWEQSDSQFVKLFVPDRHSPEDFHFRFHDPYPQTWVDETVEDACFTGSKKTDPFMHRLKELEDLKEETVLWEMYKDDRAKQGSKQAFNATSNSRTQSARVITPQLTRAKSAVNRLKRSSSAGKTSLSNHVVSQVYDDSSDGVQTFRNSGYQPGISFVPGSLYPEARSPMKARSRTPTSKPSSGVNSTNNLNASHCLTIQTKDDRKKPSAPKCEKCSPRPAVIQRTSCASPRIVSSSVQSLRNQYALKATECYDIVELARTFDPPCKNEVKAAKKNFTTSSTENAVNKGIKPGKSYFSQRRISLTRLTPDEGISVRGVNPQNVTRSTSGRCKSAKRGPKRR